MRADVPTLRSARLVREIERSFARACERGDFRLVHYSIQRNHVHLLVEGTGVEALGRGMKSIGAHLARCVNRVYGRRGPVLADRYHARALRTPREARATLRYVLLNARRHGGGRTRAVRIDGASSGRWFDGWAVPIPSSADPPAVASPHSWLLRSGWRRHGLIHPADVPG